MLGESGATRTAFQARSASSSVAHDATTSAAHRFISRLRALSTAVSRSHADTNTATQAAAHREGDDALIVSSVKSGASDDVVAAIRDAHRALSVTPRFAASPAAHPRPAPSHAPHLRDIGQ